MSIDLGKYVSWPPNELFIVFSFVAFILCILPFPFYLQAWNVGTSCFCFWVGLACLNGFINAIIWNHNMIDWAPVWCDISTRIILSENVSIPICCLVINRRLYCMATTTSVITLRYDRRRAITSDLLLCLGVPVLQMIIALVPMGNRFSIYEDIGCATHIPCTWVSILLINSWPLVIGLASAYYCIRCLVVLNRYRQRIREVHSGGGGPNQSMYIRLMLMTGSEMLFTIPLSSFIIWMNTRGYRPWISWDDVHADFLRVDKYPAALWHTFPLAAGFEVTRWFKIMAAFLFFGLYGMVGEFRRKYKKAFRDVVEWFGLSTPHKVRSENAGVISMPLIFASRQDRGNYKSTLGSESRFASGVDDLSETRFRHMEEVR
uniref:Putative pheromone receptor protein isoform s2 n=2 Tax=Flammulina TaxID=38944 RepID=A0A6C0MZY2_9AGAR|nr:putative pheromone receptor protein isoform s2 [Flammulina filiformis]